MSSFFIFCLVIQYIWPKQSKLGLCFLSMSQSQKVSSHCQTKHTLTSLCLTESLCQLMSFSPTGWRCDRTHSTSWLFDSCHRKKYEFHYEEIIKLSDRFNPATWREWRGQRGVTGRVSAGATWHLRVQIKIDQRGKFLRETAPSSGQF